MRQFLKSQFHISSSQIKIFFGTGIAMFAMTFLIQFGVKLPHLPKKISPDVSWQKVKKKLDTNLSPVMVLHHPATLPLIETTYADTKNSSSAAYAVINLANGDILLSKNSTKRLPIASLTKLMSAMVALDLVSPKANMMVTKKASLEIPTKIGVVTGQTMELHDLLAAMLLTSANDAAEVVRDGVDSIYHEPVFIKAMNKKASLLGLSNTHFVSPQGFDDAENYSTAEDLGKLTQYALANYPEIAGLVQQSYLFVPATKAHKQFDLYNWNGLLGVYPGVFGVKIGNTGDAKSTTIVASKRQGITLLAVVLGAPDIRTRDLLAANLLNTGFQDYNIQPFTVTNDMLTAKYASWKYWQ